MWPLLLDMTKEESIQNLRNLELEAYSHLVSALRAQGPLNTDKRKLLKDTSEVLNITQERYKAEIRRAVSDERLNTIAYHVTGQAESAEDWAQEGRRLIPLIPRLAPQTAYSAIADEIAETASQTNKQLPPPSNTERKRTLQTQSQIPLVIPENSKAVPFRIPEPPKSEEIKKRKMSICTENSSLAQHLLGPAKASRIQQLYRQKTKAKTKDPPYHLNKFKQEQQLEQEDMGQQRLMHQTISQLSKFTTTSTNGPKINVLQNISLQPATAILNDSIDQQSDLSGNVNQKVKTDAGRILSSPGCSNENQAPVRPKIVTNVKPNITYKQVSSSASPTTVTTVGGPSSDMQQKTIKMCPSKKTFTKSTGSGQKLIVVSNAQTIPTSSILQRTLSLPFMKNVSVKNFEKFKIVTSNSSSQSATITNSSANSVKHKVVTVRTNPTTKKVIPLSQLQVLNSKGGIKVLPLGGKIVGKSVASTASPPLYIMNPASIQQTINKTTTIVSSSSSKPQEVTSEDTVVQMMPTSSLTLSPNRENGKSSVLEDILKASGVITSESPEEATIKIEEEYKTRIDDNYVDNNIAFDNIKDEIKDEIKFDDFNGTEEIENAEIVCKLEEECIRAGGDEQNITISEEVIEAEKDPSETMMETEEVPFSNNLSPHVVLQVESSSLNDINELN